MKPEVTFKHEFVEFIPNEIEERTIYISIEFATATHRCACGCRLEVVTPFSPTDWELIFNGKSVSLDPSIGNWNFPCRSHYWIKRNKVQWARAWSKEQIKAGRDNDLLQKQRYIEDSEVEKAQIVTDDQPKTEEKLQKGFWQWLKEKLF